MKNRSGWVEFGVLFVLLIFLVFAGCSLDFSQTSTQTQTSPTGPSGEPAASPTPTPLPGVPLVASVRLAEIARESCASPPDPTVLQPPPCKAILTCTPVDSTGRDVGLSYAPEWDISGPGGVTPTSLNPYNARAECDGPSGSILVTCSVGGKMGVKGYACRG